jgi:enoyl-CoA hydratase/carnithine racemase
MTELSDYAKKYTCARLRREEAGILEVQLHTDGGSLVWNEAGHRELGSLWLDIADDFENRVVILTGTGDAFCAEIDSPSFRGFERGWDKIYWEGKRLLQSLLDIDVPVIAAINGPARVHSELPLLSDIVLCSTETVFQDHPHLPRGSVPGDGMHLVWPELIGPNRARYFLFTGQEITAEEALGLGVVNEVLAPSALLPRARQLASELAAKPTMSLRYTRVCVVQRWKRLLLDDLSHGLMLEGAAAAARR